MSATLSFINFSVQSQKAHQVSIGNLTPLELLTHLDKQLTKRKFFVVDACLPKYYPSLFEEWSYPTLFLQGGEEAKTIKTAMKICDFLALHNAEREDFLVVMGGGTVGDVAGFAASIYKRGINWHFVPTTLLSQVDSSIGGKVAINRDEGKNLLGSFWPAQQVWVTPSFLDSLPPNQYAAGIAEVIKVATLGNTELWQLLEEGEKRIDSFLIEKAIQAKFQIIDNDWFEEKNGTRAALNFGHTLGHAFEKIDPTLLHGQAIALGMLVELKIGNLLGENVFSYSLLKECLKKYELSVDYSHHLNEKTINSLVSFMCQDKKNEANLIGFRVPLYDGKVKKLLVNVLQLKEILISL